MTVAPPSAEFRASSFGNVRSQTGSSANEYTYAGEQTDSTDLQYLRARYYDPAVGRFMSQDPLPLLQRYAYVGNNPANFVDPTGLCGWQDLLDCVDPRRLADPLIGLLPEGSFRIGDQTISWQLAATCIQYPEACAAALAAAPIASTAASLLYSEAELLEGSFANRKEGDAFQHCYWSGLITLQVGPGSAEKVTTRFEATGNNEPQFREYDLYNNRRGREFAQYLPGGPNPASAGALLGYCRGG